MLLLNRGTIILGKAECRCGDVTAVHTQYTVIAFQVQREEREVKNTACLPSFYHQLHFYITEVA